MKQSINLFFHSYVAAVCMGGLLGILCFLCTYGTAVLNPTFDSWIFSSGGDLAQHYIGWLFFRDTPWRFPFGLTEGLIHDTAVSCMFTDSIPLLALPFKLLSPVLPETFQYIGLWELLCFAAQGALAAAILYRLRPSVLFCGMGSLLYILSPAVFQRAFHHEALSGHWVILLALLLWMRQKYQSGIRTSALLWSLCSVLAVLTHLYYLPMIFLLMAGAALTDVFLFRNCKRALVCIGVSAFSALLTLYGLGAFYGESHLLAGGLGRYSANLNCLWNSMGYSRFLEKLPYRSGQTEGLGYLGLGALLAVGAAFLAGAYWILRRRSSLKKHFSTYGWELLAGSIVLLADVFLAVSPICTFGETVLYQISYPPAVQILLSMFRASGRFIWVAGYLILTAALGIWGRCFGKRLLACAAVLCACVQIADLSGVIAQRQQRFFMPEPYVSPLSDPLWEELAEEHTEIIFLPLEQDYLKKKEKYFVFAEFAHRHGMSLSSFYLARASFDAMSSFAQEEMQRLAAGRGNPEALYLFEVRTDVSDAPNLNIYEIDGYTVVCVKEM